jgi:DNA polymerase I
LAKRFRAWLLDVEFVQREGKPALRLFLKDERTGHAFRLYDESFEPYFLVLPRGDPADAERLLQKTRVRVRIEHAEVKRVERVRLQHFGESKEFLKVFAFHPAHVPKLREAAKPLGETFEYDIPWTRRYLIDRALSPTSLVEGEADGRVVKSVRAVPTDESPVLRTVAFDIETYNPKGAPDPRRDPVLMASYADGRENEVLSHTKHFKSKHAKSLKTEREMIEALCDVFRAKHADVLATYNGDQFDLPYLAERARALKARFWPGRDRVPPKTHGRGIRNATRVGGRVHLDVYNAMGFLEVIGAIRPPRLTLEKVYEEVLGGRKLMVPKQDIYKRWDRGGEPLDELAEYCRGDSKACWELAQYALPLEVELSRASGLTLYDASRATTGQLVEARFLREARERGIVAFNRPHGEELEEREEAPIKGALVKTPEAGVYENLAVVDFKSMYPSIIISHNVDPASLDARCCGGREVHVAPEGQRFCKRHPGLVPIVLRKLLEARGLVKAQMRKAREESPEHKRLYARQWALKIMANSSYGYLLYPRSRWYSRPCGEAVTAWGRHYITDIAKRAEDAGLKVLYYDTDGAVLQYGERGEEGAVEAWVEEMNEALPEAMELELEDFYPRGVFVSKKQEPVGAKKKYALISRSGKIKIRGFELVRRDWSRVARHTQQRVLEILLREGDVPRAVEFVRGVIEELRAGRVPLEECVIWTQLRKKAKAYEVISPELAAWQKARAAGLPLEEGAVIGYVVTRKGKTISEKAQVAELAKDYDADYYVNKQVLPAVLKILGALDVKEEDVTSSSKQKGLGEY